MSSIDWGSVPDWLAGIGAVMALAFAALAVRAAQSANRQQNKQLQLIQNESLKAQASKVAVWPTLSSDDRIICKLRNGSDLPIFGVLLFRGLASLDGEEQWWRHERYRAIGPGDYEYEWSASMIPDEHAGFARPNDPNANLAVIVFLDSSGRYWIRDSYGSLRLLTDSDSYYYIVPRQWLSESDEPKLKGVAFGGTNSLTTDRTRPLA